MKSILNLQAEYLMWNARLDNSQARIKISKRNINNLRYADYTNFMAETENELKELLIKLKEESECWFISTLKKKKTKITASSSII